MPRCLATRALRRLAWPRRVTRRWLGGNRRVVAPDAEPVWLAAAVLAGGLGGA